VAKILRLLLRAIAAAAAAARNADPRIALAA